MAILEEHSETTVTKNSAYSPGVRIFTTYQLQQDVLMIIVEVVVESMGVERFSLGRILEITDAMAVTNNQSRLKKKYPMGQMGQITPTTRVKL